MDVLKGVGTILLGLASLSAFLWLGVKFLALLDARGLGRSLHRGDPRVEPAKIDVQSLFHGNTKDEDQI